MRHKYVYNSTDLEISIANILITAKSLDGFNQWVTVTLEKVAS